MTTDLTSIIDATENALFAVSCEHDITVTVRDDDEDTIVVGWMTEDADFDWSADGERVDDAVAAAARTVLEAHGFDLRDSGGESECMAGGRHFFGGHWHRWERQPVESN